MRSIYLCLAGVIGFIAPNVADAKPKKKNPQISRLGVSVFTGFPLVAGGGFEYRFLPGFFTDFGVSMGLGRVNNALSAVPTVEWGFSTATGNKKQRLGGYIKACGSFKNPQDDAFASFGLNVRRVVTPKRGKTLNLQFGPGLYINKNASSIFGNRFGLYAKIAYHQHKVK